MTAFHWVEQNSHLYNKISLSPLELCVLMQSNINNTCQEDQETIQSHDNMLEENILAPVNYSVPNNSDVSQGNSNTNVIRIPRNNANPVSIYEIPYGEEQAFPRLFPQGKYGFTYERKLKNSPSMYFRYRLFNKHVFWRKDMTYLLHAAVSYDSMLLKKQINICMKMRKVYII